MGHYGGTEWGKFTASYEGKGQDTLIGIIIWLLSVLIEHSWPALRSRKFLMPDSICFPQSPIGFFLTQCLNAVCGSLATDNSTQVIYPKITLSLCLVIVLSLVPSLLWMTDYSPS